MKRHDDLKTTIVYAYGCLEPLNWDDEISEHAWLQNKLWNRLVEIDRAHNERYRQAILQDQTVAELEAQLTTLLDQKEQVYRTKKEIRKASRSLARIETKPLDSQLKTLQATIAERRAALKIERARARTVLQPILDTIESSRREAVNTARKESQLWWGNYNAVIDSYETARVRARKEGRDLRFHRFDGGCRFTVQVQGGAQPEELMGGHYQPVRLQMLTRQAWCEATGRGYEAARHYTDTKRERRQYAILQFTVFTGKDDNGAAYRRYLDMPIILHRPLPLNGVIKYVSVCRKRIGIQFRWQATFTVQTERPPVEHSSTAVAGINFGWKKVGDGLRVATVADTDGHVEHLVLPTRFMDRINYTQELSSQLDTALNGIAPVIAALPEEGMPEPLIEHWQVYKKAKKPYASALARIAAVWREHPHYEPAALAQLEIWRKLNKRLTIERAFLRRRLLADRENLYRCVSKRWAHAYAVVLIDDMDLRQAARVERGDGQDPELHAQARLQRTLAAVSSLREWITKQAAKTGTRIEKQAAPVTIICHQCGRQHKRESNLLWACLCGSRYDQDENAAFNYLTLYTQQPQEVFTQLSRANQ